MRRGFFAANVIKQFCDSLNGPRSWSGRLTLSISFSLSAPVTDGGAILTSYFFRSYPEEDDLLCIGGHRFLPPPLRPPRASMLEGSLPPKAALQSAGHPKIY